MSKQPTNSGIPVHASEIRWTLEPAPRPEVDIDVLDLFDMDPGELVTYCCWLRDALQASRATTYATLDQVVALTKTTERQNATIVRLIEQLRTQRGPS